MTALSSRERAALAAIRAAVRERGYPPTMRELGAAIGLASPGSVHAVLAGLAAKGFIRRDPRTARAIQVLDPGGVTR